MRSDPSVTNFGAAVEWMARDLLHSAVASRELFRTFSQPPDTPLPTLPLATRSRWRCSSAGLLRRPLFKGPSMEGEQPECEPSSSVAIESSRSTPLLSAEGYDMMPRAYAFLYLTELAGRWVGHAIDLFLHALLRPEAVGRGNVLNILSKIQRKARNQHK
ncbi:hypothetical protein F4677DRAFT_25593 [Hypoxylon crocopeplum]|nr:hypothetical protein F4677DRAFT_25593 [Hypoxylon crocopeplum]